MANQSIQTTQHLLQKTFLNREFKAEHLNEKWVTDVTEFKYGNTLDSVHKVYLSAILDLCDRRPVAYVIVGMHRYSWILIIVMVFMTKGRKTTFEERVELFNIA